MTEDENTVLNDPALCEKVAESRQNINPQPRPGKPIPLAEDPDIPILEGWVGITEAGNRLGITRQHSYKRAQRGGYRTLHRIAGSATTVVSETEINDILAKREEKAKEEPDGSVE